MAPPFVALRFRDGDYIDIMTLVSIPSQAKVMSGSHSMVDHTKTTVLGIDNDSVSFLPQLQYSEVDHTRITVL